MLKATIRTFTVLILISLSFIGSDCNKLIETVDNPDCTGSQVDIIGTWKFVYNNGGIRDVCLGESVQFTTGGTAFLTCPGQQTIQREYSVSSDYILTYTTSNIKYCLSGDANELQLTGLNNNRILVYLRDTTDEIIQKGGTNEGAIYLNNSSEITKTNN